MVRRHLIEPRARLINLPVPDPYGPGDVLYRLFARVLKSDIRLAGKLVMHSARYADAARFRQTFQPCGDVDAISQNVVSINNNVSEIDADAVVDAPLLRNVSLTPAIACCTSTAHFTASTTLGNSTNTPSPVVLTMRPPCAEILGSMSSSR